MTENFPDGMEYLGAFLRKAMPPGAHPCEPYTDLCGHVVRYPIFAGGEELGTYSVGRNPFGIAFLKYKGVHPDAGCEVELLLVPDGNGGFVREDKFFNVGMPY